MARIRISAGNSDGLKVLGIVYVQQKLSAPHTWHAAESVALSSFLGEDAAAARAVKSNVLTLHEIVPGSFLDCFIGRCASRSRDMDSPPFCGSRRLAAGPALESAPVASDAQPQ